MVFKIGIIGTGAVANVLASSLRKRRLTATTIIGRLMPAARHVASVNGIKRYGTDFQLLKDCNFIIITVSDPAIRSVSEKITEVVFKTKKVILVHTSGSLTSDVLRNAKKNVYTKIETASMHPMQTFPGELKQKKLKSSLLNNIYFGIEGDKEAITPLRQLIKILKAYSLVIPAEFKPLYHIGGVMASNFLVALLFEIKNLYARIGLSEKQMLSLLTPLIETTIQNVKTKGIRRSLTGPASRKDLDTIQKHINILSQESAEIELLYKQLTDICLKIT